MTTTMGFMTDIITSGTITCTNDIHKKNVQMTQVN